MRAASRRESQQRRMREKKHLKGLSSSYLDQDMDDEEDFEGSLSAITNKYKEDVKSNLCFKPLYSTAKLNTSFLLRGWYQFQGRT